MFMFHCMNYKLERAVHDDTNSTNKVSHLRMFLDTLLTVLVRLTTVRFLQVCRKHWTMRCVKFEKCLMYDGCLHLTELSMLFIFLCRHLLVH